MSWSEIYASTPMLEALAKALVIFLAQGTLLAMGLATLLAVIPERFARGRYALACAVLVAMALCPVVTTWFLLDGPEPSAESAAGIRADRSSLAPSHLVPLVSSPSWEGGSRSPETPKARGATARGASLFLQPVLQDGSNRLRPWLPAVVAAWLLGVIGLTATHVGAWRRLHRLRQQSQPAEPAWRDTMARLVRRIGIGKAVDLLVSHQISVPMVVGWFRPVVLVPASAMVGLAPQQLESLVVHELAHIRRLDPWVNGLQVILETLLFYHPAVWWTSAQVRHLREHCCDDIAVQICGDRLTYLRALADLEGLRAAAATLPGSPRLALGADGGSLLARVRRLAGAGAERTPHRSASSGLVVVLTTALLAVVSLASLAQVAPPEAPEPHPVQPPTPPKPVAAPTPMPVAPPAAAPRPPRPPKPAPGIGVPPTPPRPVAPATAGPDASGRYSVEQLIAFKVHGIDELAEELAGTRFESLPPEELLPLASLDIDREWIESWETVGFGTLEIDELIFLAGHDVSPETVRELRQSGLEIERPADAVQASIHDLRPEVIQELRRAGLGELELQSLLPLAIHGIDGEQIQRFREAGVRIDTPGDILVLVVSGVDLALPRALRDLGLDDLDAHELAELTHLGLDTDKLAELRAEGLQMATLRELRRLTLRGHGHHPPIF